MKQMNYMYELWVLRETHNIAVSYNVAISDV